MGRRIATFAFALPFAPFGTLCLRDTRAVGLVVPISFAPMALNVVGRGGHSCSTSSDGGPRRFPRQLVNVKISGCLLDLVEGERAVPVVHLLDEFELPRERVQEQISVRIIENFLPYVREDSRRSSIFVMKSVGSLPVRIALEKSFSRHARLSSFVIPSKRSFKDFQAATPSPKQPCSVLSCARTAIFAEPSVKKNKME